MVGLVLLVSAVELLLAGLILRRVAAAASVADGPAERGGEVSGWGAEHHLLRVPSSANREERALTVAMDAIDRVLTLADQMDKAPDAHTRALAASIRNAVTGGSDG